MLTSVSLRYFKANWEESEYMLIKNKMSFWLKKDTIEIFLWLRMSLQREKQREESLMFTYVTTLGELLSLEEVLEKVSQLGWFSTPTNIFPPSLFELGIDQIVVYEGS